MEAVRSAFGNEAHAKLGEFVPAVAEEARPDIAAMVAEVARVKQLFGTAPAWLEEQIEAARRKRDEAKPSHIRVQNAKDAHQKAGRLHADAMANRDRLQQELADAEQAVVDAAQTVEAAKAELEAQQRSAWTDGATPQVQQIQQSVAILGQALGDKPEAQAALQSLAVWLPQPVPMEPTQLESQQPPASQAKEDSAAMEVDVAFDELDEPSRTAFLKQVGGEGQHEDQEVAAKAKRLYEASVEMAKAAKKQRK